MTHKYLFFISLSEVLCEYFSCSTFLFYRCLTKAAGNSRICTHSSGETKFTATYFIQFIPMFCLVMFVQTFQSVSLSTGHNVINKSCRGCAIVLLPQNICILHYSSCRFFCYVFCSSNNSNSLSSAHIPCVI